MSTLASRWLAARSLAVTAFALLAGCTVTPPIPETVAVAPAPCRIVYDASSSNTALYIYEKRGERWIEHPGPKGGALADPVRQMRGKTNADLDAVTTEVVAALDRIRQTGPADAKGRPAWPAFDWTRRCRITAATVFATAGMRIAEQEHREQSRVLWETLNRKLQARLGPDVVVTTRTLTGFEEGLYAWLAVAESRPDLRFGIAEMGGASTQVTFPCSACDAKDDAVRSIYVRGQPLAMYSYSFLGLGQDEAPKTIGQPAACAYGVGTVTPSWQPADCGNQMRLLTPAGLPDPFNYAGGQRGTSRDIPTERGDVKEWVLTGAFNFWDDGQIETCCRTRGQCFNEATACFRPIYFERYLQALRIPATGPRADVSWTLGSVICAETQCLRDATPAPVCQWSDKGCL